MAMANEKTLEENGKRRVLDWIGYKKDEVSATPMTPEIMLATIAKLQDEVETLRAQKDFHELDSHELEALASETAVTILATVHKREAEAKKVAASTIANSEKKADQIVAAAEKSASDLIAAAEKKLKDSDKQANQTITAAESTASATLKNATTEAKQIVTAGESEASKTVRDANALAESTRRDSDSYAAKVRREADAYAASSVKEVTDQATAIRREIANSLAVARANHLAAAEAQDKARQTAEKAYTTIVSSIESFDEHSKKIQAALKSSTEK